MIRCPRCGTPADAVPVTHHLRRDQARRLREMVDVVRRELGLPTDGEALLAAARIAALDLNQRSGVVSGYSGHEAPGQPNGRSPMGEHENEGGGAAAQTEGQPAEQAEDGAAQTEGAPAEGTATDEPAPAEGAPAEAPTE